MWVMTSFGILMPAKRPEKYTPSWDDRTMQIRARCSHHLDILRAEYMKGALGETIYSPDKDYEYRAYCTPDSWAVAMMKMSLDIDYVKFKPTTYRYQDTKLHDVYNRIWGVVISMLGTRTHQHEYWHSTGTGSAPGSQPWRPEGTAGKSVTALGKGGAGGGTGWPDAPPAKARVKPSPHPRPQSSGGGTTVRTGPYDWDDARSPMPLGYPKDYSDYEPGYRDTSADRDEYVPEVWDTPIPGQPWTGVSGLSDEDLAAVDAVIDNTPLTAQDLDEIEHARVDEAMRRARQEIEDLQWSLLDPISHKNCPVHKTNEVREACRTKFYESTLARIRHLEELVGDVQTRRWNQKLELPAASGTR